MTAAAKPGTLAEALVAAQADMPKVEPDKQNPHFRSMFVSLDHLIAKTRPVLNKHGLAISQSPTHIDGTPALETTIHHVSGEHVSSVMPLLVSKADMQGLGGALTYARRYAWAAALGICADEDDDGEQAAVASEKSGEQKNAEPEGFKAPDLPAPTVAQQKAFAAALAEWKKESPDFDVQGAVAAAKDKDGHWLDRQTKRLLENVAAAEIPF